jgi:hypothetical protein
MSSKDYYKTSSIECIDVIEELSVDWHGSTSFNLGNVLKYIFRYQKKDSGTDGLVKARYYLDREIKKRYGL